MKIPPIRTDADHADALKEIERLWDAPVGSAEGGRLDVLATLATVPVPISPALVEKIAELTKDVEVDLEKPIGGEVDF